MLDRLEFVLTEAFVSLGRNRWMSFAAITTAAMALLLLGGLGYVYLQIKARADELPSKFEISAFFKDSGVGRAFGGGADHQGAGLGEDEPGDA
jgi:cell division protein FtsX